LPRFWTFIIYLLTVGSWWSHCYSWMKVIGLRRFEWLS
jgi:hypothetical protein